MLSVQITTICGRKRETRGKSSCIERPHLALLVQEELIGHAYFIAGQTLRLTALQLRATNMYSFVRHKFRTHLRNQEKF